VIVCQESERLFQLGSAKCIVSKFPAIKAREVNPEGSEVVSRAQLQRKVKFADEAGSSS
jgi:hypothetical protein